MTRAKLKVQRSPGRNAVAYLRKSTDAQEASIDRQREAVYSYAAKHGYDLIGEYVDAGISGVDSSDRRPDYQRLVTDAPRGGFDYVIVWDLSRLSRSDPMETFAELRPLRRAGVRVATTDRPEPLDWDSFAGQLVLSIEAEGNNQYVRKLARNTTSGQLRKAKQGKWVAGRPPLGYAVDDEDRLILGDERDRETVRLMFEKYATGHSFRDLIAWLRTRGQDRCVSWVRQSLANRLYTGDFVWGRNCQAMMYSVSEGEVSESFTRGQTTEANQVILPDNHPPIVERELFDSVQATFARRRRGTTPHKQGGGFVLSGLLRCADCGYTMIGHNDHKAKVKRYRCGGCTTRGVAFCHPHLVTQNEVLNAVLQAFEERFAGKAVAKARRELNHELTRRNEQAKDEKGIARALARLDEKLDKAAARLIEVEADLLPIVQKKIRELRREREGLEKELQRIRKPAQTVLLDFDARVERGLAVLKQLRQAAAHADASELRHFLQTTVKEIRVQVSQRPAGKRFRYTFAGGEIILHQTADLFSSW